MREKGPPYPNLPLPCLALRWGGGLLTFKFFDMSRKMQLDWKDFQILNIVKDDARITYKELADKIDLTESPTYTRFQNLLKNGIIRFVRAVIDLESVGYQMPLVMLFKVPEGEENTLVKLVDEHKAVLYWFDLKSEVPQLANYHVLIAVATFRSGRQYNDFLVVLNSKLTFFMEMQVWTITREWTGTFEF